MGHIDKMAHRIFEMEMEFICANFGMFATNSEHNFFLFIWKIVLQTPKTAPPSDQKIFSNFFLDFRGQLTISTRSLRLIMNQ